MNVMAYFKSKKSPGPPSILQIRRQQMKFERKKQDANKPTLVFDMDETLIHCLEPEDGHVRPDFSLDIRHSVSGIVNKVKYWIVTMLTRLEPLFDPAFYAEVPKMSPQKI